MRKPGLFETAFNAQQLEPFLHSYLRLVPHARPSRLLQTMFQTPIPFDESTVHTSGTPNRDCRAGRLDVSSASGRCSGSGKRAGIHNQYVRVLRRGREDKHCKYPKRLCTPRSWLMPGWLDILCLHISWSAMFQTAGMKDGRGLAHRDP